MPRSARRGGKVPSAGGLGAGAASRAPVAAPGSSPPPSRRPQRPPSPGFPATGSSRERRTHPRCSVPRCKAGRCGPGVLCRRPGSARRPGGARGEIAVACTSVNLPSNAGGETLPLLRGLRSAFSPSSPTHEDTRTSSINPLQLRSPLPADFYIREGE